jgi:hypothetical protein
MGAYKIAALVKKVQTPLVSPSLFMHSLWDSSSPSQVPRVGWFWACILVCCQSTRDLQLQSMYIKHKN